MQWKTEILEIIKQHRPGVVDLQQIYTELLDYQLVTEYHRKTIRALRGTMQWASLTS